MTAAVFQQQQSRRVFLSILRVRAVGGGTRLSMLQQLPGGKLGTANYLVRLEKKQFASAKAAKLNVVKTPHHCDNTGSASSWLRLSGQQSLFGGLVVSCGFQQE
ncbi:unnamed protein product [Ectocarpus sp. 13 AM-2016]